MSDFRNALAQFNLDATLIDDAAADFDSMIRNLDTPSEHWECMGTGSYKECYFIGNVAVKFALENNDTFKREKPVYDEALAAGLDKVFAHTIFLPLEKPLPVCFVGQDDETFDCVILQEKIPSILGDKENIHAILWYDKEKGYVKTPLIHEGKIVPFRKIELLAQIFCYQEWMQAGIDFYGLDFMLKLADFCEDMWVDDLHAWNLGFRADGSPVIFDFLS